MNPLEKSLGDLLTACDHAALSNVRAGRGGPFAASMHVHDRRSDAWVTVVPPCGNAVIETGQASAHAEDRVLAAAHLASLKKTLQQYEPGQANVYVVSSAESCPACHAKLEIAARQLRADGIIGPGCFHVAYGASYEETASIAGFNDAPYHHDFQNIPGTGLIKQKFLDMQDIPEPVRSFMRREGPCAVVVSQQDVDYATGERPEISAIQKISAQKKKRGDPAPWDLGGAILYTCVRDIGPMAYAECQWSHVACWVTVSGCGGHVERQEAPGISNHDLFRVVAARPYTHPQSALHFLHIRPFANLAQQEWQKLSKLGKVQSYNGIKE